MRLAGCLVLVLAGACGFGDNGRSSPIAGADAGPGDAAPPSDAPDVPDPDAPAEPACSIVPQGGCASGQACDFGTPADGPFECRAVTKNGTADSRCALDTECAPGFTCLVHATDLAACSRFCDSDAQCGVNARCVHDVVSGGQPLGVRVCSNACNTLSQTGARAASRARRSRTAPATSPTASPPARSSTASSARARASACRARRVSP